MFTVSDARNVLRVDEGVNDGLIASLVEALPDYIETATGMPPDQQTDDPLVSTVSGFLVTLWYYADHTDDMKLQRTIDSLLKCITLKARKVQG